MRKTVLLAVCLFSLQKHVVAQGLMGIQRPSSQPFPFLLDKVKPESKKEKAIRKAAAERQAQELALKSLNIKEVPRESSAYQDSLTHYMDLLMNQSEDTVAIKYVDTLNKTSPVKILATGGISKIEDAKSSSGNLAIGIQFRLSRFKRIEQGRYRNWIDPKYLYFMFNAKTATSDDTASMQKMFLFPELSRREFVIGYYQQYMKNDWAIEPIFEASLNKYVDTADSKKLFRSESFLLGVKISKSFFVPGTNVTCGFQLFPYYNLITVDPKYFTNYASMVKPANAHPTFHNIGLQSIVQVDKVFFFCNAKYVLNKSSDPDNPDFVRFVYTIGGMVAL